METFLLHSGLITVWEYAGNVAVRFAGTVLISAKLRRLMFLRFLRLRAVEEPKDMSGLPMFAQVNRI